MQRHNEKTGKRVECTLDTQSAVKYMKDVQQSPGKLDHNEIPVQTYCLHQNMEVWPPPGAGGEQTQLGGGNEYTGHTSNQTWIGFVLK